MADQILNAVIQLETQIEQQVQSEQARAAAWLEGVRREQGGIISQAGLDLALEKQQLISTAQQLADQQAAVLLQQEMEYCRRLEAIDELTLVEVLRRQLVNILPRQVDDHQNGKN